MKEKKFTLIDEQSSPLFRIMSIYNDDEPTKRGFDNNICAFHIGNGYILSVAHNLRTEAGLFRTIPEEVFSNRIIQNLNEEEKRLFERFYILDQQNSKRHLNTPVQEVNQQLANILQQRQVDRRWIKAYEDNICKPFLIIQFRDNQFFQDSELTKNIPEHHKFTEQDLNRHTIIIELELVEAYYNKDIALYKIVNTDERIIRKIPSVDIDFEIYDQSPEHFYCLQSAPVDNLGRLLNRAEIEGILDHWNKFTDKFDGNYIMDGSRYLIKGYFRFGSSGAPYLTFDTKTNKFRANAIQSEASPIQLSINNSRNGNFQYINAIASPIGTVKNEILKHTTKG